MSKKDQSAAAVHVQAGNKHIVSVKSLHVMLIPDGNYWFAQGLEIDYAATGNTVESAKENFSAGLAKTIVEHLVMHGGIEQLLKVAHQDVWTEYFQTLTGPTDVVHASLTQIQATEVKKQSSKSAALKRKPFLPFDDILFVKSAKDSDQREAALA